MSIPAERLREGQQILVRGKVSFSRLTALITGDELAKSIERARKRGSIYPTEDPHTTISLLDPQVVFIDPANPTQEELFVNEKFYVTKTGANAGRGAYSLDSTSPYLPTVLEKDPADPTGQAYRQLVLERDLDTDLDVTLVIQVFKPKTREKRGLGLQQVILNEPVRYFSGGGGASTEALAARGIIVNGAIEVIPATAAAPEAAAAVASQAPFGAPAQAQTPYGAPVQAPVGAPSQDPYGVPANTMVGAGGLPGPMPGAQGTPVQPQAVYPPQAQAPVQPAVPVQQAPVQQVAPAQPAQPATPAVETPEQQIARLQAQLAESQNAAAASGGASAFDGAAPAAAEPNPWTMPQVAPAFQG